MVHASSAWPPFFSIALRVSSISQVVPLIRALADFAAPCKGLRRSGPVISYYDLLPQWYGCDTSPFFVN